MSTDPSTADYVTGAHEHGNVPLRSGPIESNALDRPDESSSLSRPQSSLSMREALLQVSSNFQQIKSAPRELWIIYILKLFSSYSYFALSLTLTLFLSLEFGLSDVDAGWSFGVYGVVATISGVICGWVIDYLGVRLSLIVGSILGTLSRIVLAFTSSRTVALTLLFSVLPFSDSLGVPIMTIGVKRYTNDTNRTFGYSLFYSVMNIAALIAGPFVDFCRDVFKHGYELPVPFYGPVYLSALRIVVLTSAASSVMMMVISVIFLREVELDEFGNVSPFTPNRNNPAASTYATLKDRAFWRLLMLTVLLVGTRLVFTHNSATLPKYLLRQFGNDAPFGLIFAINPFLIIILVPMVGLLTKHIDSFPMILYGSFVASASPFFICIQQSYVMIVLYMTVLSLGEAVYSPRVYEYAMILSADGAEGLYTSLSAAPLFSAQLISGGMSGWLLSSFMPRNGPHMGKVVWGFIGGVSMTSPILMCLFRGFIGTDEASNSDTASDLERSALIKRIK